jgi:hypothetical protein
MSEPEMNLENIIRLRWYMYFEEPLAFGLCTNGRIDQLSRMAHIVVDSGPSMNQVWAIGRDLKKRVTRRARVHFDLLSHLSAASLATQNIQPNTLFSYSCTSLDFTHLGSEGGRSVSKRIDSDMFRAWVSDQHDFEWNIRLSKLG